MNPATGKLLIELASWLIGATLIAIYFGATIGFEEQRRSGIEIFAKARFDAQSLAADAVPVAGPVMPDDLRSSKREKVNDDRDALPIAVLRIPAVELEVPVFDDVSERNLSRGAGWIPGTALPNEGGNIAIAAHRDRYFRVLKNVAVGDVLELESLESAGTYRVTSLDIVEPEELWPLDAADVDTVTLVTCYPFYFIGSAPQRFIVQAVIID